MRPLVLASTSPWRRRLLEQAGLPFEAVDPQTPEPLARDADPLAQAEAFACAKARAVRPLRPGAIVVGSDQVLEFEGRSYGKVESPEAALEQLRMLAGGVHRLVTAVCVLVPGAPDWCGHEAAALRMRDLSDAELRAYVATGEWRGCAGSYRLEGRGVALFERIDGEHTTILGLPMPLLLGRLRASGVPLFG